MSPFIPRPFCATYLTLSHKKGKKGEEKELLSFPFEIGFLEE